MFVFVFFFNDTATTEIYTLSLHDALPIWTHDINALARRLAKENSAVPLTEDEILLLSSVYIDTRYPPDVGLLPNGAPTKKDVDSVINSVLKIEKWIGSSKD